MLSKLKSRLVEAGPALTTLALCCVVAAGSASVRGQSSTNSGVAAPQKRRVVARGDIKGNNQLQQLVTWQTSNPPRGTLPYARAHLAIETTGARPVVLWQTDGGASQYLVDSIRIHDLDGDGVPEIISMWWEGASAGAVLRVFHWSRRKRSFVELRSDDDLDGVHRYEVSSDAHAPAKSSIAVFVRSDVGSGWPPVAGGRYEVRGTKLVRVNGGAVVAAQDKSGIEGQAVISPAHPGPIRQGESGSAPLETTLVVRSANDAREVARLETGSDGRFRVVLPPGTYTIGSPERAGRFLPRAAEETVTVEAGKFARVTITFDSGMR